MRERIHRLLAEADLAECMSEISALPGRKAINPLFSALLNQDERVRRRAVSAMGVVVKGLMDADPESARVIMRRLMWSLNDESGGIGWGAPEALAEIMAVSPKLAEEFSSILVSYLNPDGNFLEYPALQRGLMWAVGRLAEVRPELLKEVPRYLGPFLESPDPEVRGLAATAAGLLAWDGACPELLGLVNDPETVRIYVDDRFEDHTVGELARNAAERIRCKEGTPAEGS